MLCCLTRDRFAKAVNEGLWLIKMLLVPAMIYGTMYLPNSIFTVYGQLAVFGSFIYLFVQNLSIVDASYLVGVFWADKFHDEENTCYAVIMLLYTILVYALSGLFFYKIILDFLNTGCYFSYVVIGSLAFFALVYLLLVVVFKLNDRSSVVTSGSVTLLLSFLAWNALLSYPNKSCNKDLNSSFSMMI